MYGGSTVWILSLILLQESMHFHYYAYDETISCISYCYCSLHSFTVYRLLTCAYLCLPVLTCAHLKSVAISCVDQYFTSIPCKHDCSIHQLTQTLFPHVAVVYHLTGADPMSKKYLISLVVTACLGVLSLTLMNYRTMNYSSPVIQVHTKPEHLPGM